MLSTEKIYLDLASDLFNEITNEEGIFFKPMSREKFKAMLCRDESIWVFDTQGNSMNGFACGNVIGEVAYISFVGVKKEFRNKGIGTRLIKDIEDKMKETGALRIDCIFHNPSRLEWFIPGHTPDDHQCAPGVDVSTDAYIFLKNLGFRDFAPQNSYYLQLDRYIEPSDIADKKKRLEESGIEITLYCKDEHRGLPEVFDDINNPGWKAQVLSNLDKPIIVAVDTNRDNLVVAYTGPLTMSESGRGTFCGIGTLHEYRGMGIGKVVFCEMCRIHSDNGAKFMALYTGEDNPARNIYEAAGFRIVRHWVGMRKLLNKKGY